MNQMHTITEQNNSSGLTVFFYLKIPVNCLFLLLFTGRIAGKNYGIQNLQFIFYEQLPDSFN